MLYVQFWAPDGGRKNRLKHVERLTEINKLWNVASCWLYSAKNYISWRKQMKHVREGLGPDCSDSEDYFLLRRDAA